MHTLIQTSMSLRFFGAVLALALIAAIAVTITLTAGPTQAQNATNTYDDPQPCGPGAGTAFQPEPHEITTGHFALFDTYWEWRHSGTEENPDNWGILHTNTCPPKVVKTTETDRDGNQTTVTSLATSNIDIDEAIFHVLDKHKATVVASPSQNPSGTEIATSEYVKLAKYTDAGDPVWWLRLDDPATTAVDETSDLTLGFSTTRFEDQWWAKGDGTPPFRYKFELYRNPGIPPSEHPHFLVYKAPGLYEGGDEQNGVELVWDSADPDNDDHDVFMRPGALQDLQWVFTEPGTYLLSVHLLGHVRQKDNPPSDAGDDWKPISGEGTIAETSEVKQYTIQIGSVLNEVEPPIFGVSFTVPDSAAAGANVGDPIRVFRADVDDLSYSLSGKGAEDFALKSTSDPDTVQIVVGDSVTLDHNRHPTYDLTLAVTDNADHESNYDPGLDDTLAVQIELTGYPRATIEIDNPNPTVGDTVTFTAVVKDFGEPGHVQYFFTDNHGQHFGRTVHTIRHTSAVTEYVGFYATYLPEGGDPHTDTQRLDAPQVTVTWSNP